MEIFNQQREIEMRHLPAVDRFKRYGRWSGRHKCFDETKVKYTHSLNLLLVNFGINGKLFKCRLNDTIHFLTVSPYLLKRTNLCKNYFLNFFPRLQN